ncbi:petrobactin biosynthesis protein AsbA [Pullulanibacillus camelliae]|uniref:Petrobactin biosynthesis protein AsbA n=1 Tax=Pullulanibacillus camelliae TaxID=1707096 RepID=A0A8J2YFK3_9BACL|nr:IucA/IucC family protein [Pullulanibacillus camelliae]GGE30170.1 petrobactin biosynthesis protein AsbA [Pullulanibacillus camelliae]
MTKVKVIAEQATIQSFVNCYLRETGRGEKQRVALTPKKNTDAKTVIKLRLAHQGINIIIPIKYWSPIGRHLFAFPLYYQFEAGYCPLPMDYITLVACMIKELLLDQGRQDSEDELMLRVILSCQNIKLALSHRIKKDSGLTVGSMDFIENEHALIFGHLLHPTPKSRQGMTDEEAMFYAPEFNGSFQLHYFKASTRLIKQASSGAISAADMLKQYLMTDDSISETFKKEHCLSQDDVLIPCHPLQAKYLLTRSNITDLIQRGQLEYLGPHGQPFTATSSIRTVYNKKSPYMFKFSLNLKITNSLRVNKQKELERGIEVGRLLKSSFGDQLFEAHPNFKIIRDPAYLTVKTGEEESGFEVVIRENPFKDDQKQETTLIAGLCQDSLPGQRTRLAHLIAACSKKDERTLEEVCLSWFQHYLNVSLRPMLWLYFQYGIVLEAHQQNAVIQLEDGYPKTFFYRDNQGYYFARSKSDRLKTFLPDISKNSDTICADSIAEERFIYYVIVNQLFGLINAFGSAGLIAEEKLLVLVYEELAACHEQHPESQLLDRLLHAQTLPCKANLLTRLHNMDELVGSLDNQSVYIQMPNPLKEVTRHHDDIHSPTY